MDKVISLVLPPQHVEPRIAAMIQISGRSWWQARYSDGRVLSEWDTLTTRPLLPVGDGRSSRWEAVSKDGMVGLRLLCPNGMCGELAAPEGHRFIQLKSGGAALDAKGIKYYTDAHIIGVVTDDKGNCFCRAWEYRKKRLIEFYDNVLDMQYLLIGRLSLDVQGVKL